MPTLISIDETSTCTSFGRNLAFETCLSPIRSRVKKKIPITTIGATTAFFWRNHVSENWPKYQYDCSTSDQFTRQFFVPSGYFWLDSSSVDLREFATRWRRLLGPSFPGDIGKAGNPRRFNALVSYRAQFGKLTCVLHDTMGEIIGSDNIVFHSLAILLLSYRRENATK